MGDPESDLCVCMTPLHVQIAARIAAHRQVPFRRGLYLSATDHPKQLYYYQRMAQFCNHARWLQLPEGSDYAWPRHLSIWRARRAAVRQFRSLKAAGTVYVPSSVSHNIYALLSTVRFRQLVTYDDGLTNVSPHAPDSFRHTGFSTKAFLLASGLTYWPERIRRRASRHYSIYDAPNVCAPAQCIELYPKDDDAIHTSEHGGDGAITQRTAILLGPYPEAGAQVWQAVASVAGDVELAGYLPHPRERERKLQDVPYIDTQLIAEDYVLTLRKLAPHTGIDVYGYDSAALPNLARAPGVRCHSLLAHAGGSPDLIALFGRLGVRMV